MVERMNGELEETYHQCQEKQPAEESVCHKPDDNKASLFLVGTHKITEQHLSGTCQFWGWFQGESNSYCH
jgi:hypothetical protein